MWALSGDLNRSAAHDRTEARPTGVRRYEEKHPDVRFNNNADFNGAISWVRFLNGEASRYYHAASRTAGDSYSLSFNGPWVSIGFLGSTNFGRAEIFIDGVSQGVFDNYLRAVGTSNRTFAGLANGPHSLLVRVLGTRNAFSSDNYVSMDYIDTSDGSTMPDGAFEESDQSRVWSSTNWSWMRKRHSQWRALLPQRHRCVVPLHRRLRCVHGLQRQRHRADRSAGGWRTARHCGHVQRHRDNQDLRLQRLRGWPACAGTTTTSRHHRHRPIDRPRRAPFYQTTAESGLVRYEEDHANWRFNNAPLAQTSSTWAESQRSNSSRGWDMASRTTNDQASIVFTGTGPAWACSAKATPATPRSFWMA